MGKIVINKTGEELKAILESLTKTEAGDLEYESTEGELTARLSDTGSFFKESVSTGVGSFHLGGSASGGLAHSISSTGQNAGFKNEWTTTDEDKKVFWFPVWQGVTTAGATVNEASTLYFGELTTVQPAGNVGGGFMNYDFNITASSDFVVFAVEVRPLISYTGKLRNRIYSVATGAEIYSTVLDVVMAGGEDYKIDYRYPFFVRNGDQLRLVLEKEDGTPLITYKGVTDNTVPWRKLHTRTLTDVFSHEGIHFGIKSVDGHTIEVNGKYLLNNWAEGSMVTITVDPRVDYVEFAPWDAAQSSTTYTEVVFPLDETGATTFTFKYKTNNPVSIFRHKNSGTEGDRYKWYVVYEGFPDARIALPTTDAGVYDAIAGRKTGKLTVSLANISNLMSTVLDDLITILTQRRDSVGAIHQMGLRLSSGAATKGINIVRFSDLTVNHVVTSVTTTTGITGIELIRDMSAGDGGTGYFYITYTDGSGQYFRRYDYTFERAGNNTANINYTRVIYPGMEAV